MILRSITLSLALSLLAATGCTKASERSNGVGDQPSHPYQNNPGTLPTQGTPATADAAAGDAEVAPEEVPDRAGTTRTPAAVTGEADAGT